MGRIHEIDFLPPRYFRKITILFYGAGLYLVDIVHLKSTITSSATARIPGTSQKAQKARGIWHNGDLTRMIGDFT